jgi:sec-independent protein translocase protein TatB
MFDLGMSELLVIGIVALIVIGPKDIPELFRSLGRFTAKMRSMAREFSRAMEAAADESGMKDVAKDLKTATSAKSMGLDAVKDAAAKFEKWDPMKNAARPTTPAAPRPATPATNATTTNATTTNAAPSPNVAMGPATQALAEQQAARKAAAAQAAEALKSTRAPAAPAEASVAPTPKPAKVAAKPRAKATPQDDAPKDAAPKPPRSPRKPKADE